MQRRVILGALCRGDALREMRGKRVESYIFNEEYLASSNVPEMVRPMEL